MGDAPDLIRREHVLKALANRRRLAILRLLKKRKELPVGEIADSIDLSFKATSKHLSVLTKAGLVEWEQRSLNYFYRLKSDLPHFVRPVIADLA